MVIIHDWSALTGPELAALATRDPVALLPVAVIEQHGPHLPLATDVIIGEALVQAALDLLRDEKMETPLLRMPTSSIGASLEHSGFAGTLSLSAELTMAMLRSAGAGVARSGIRRLLIFNNHGGNKAPIDMAACSCVPTMACWL